MNTPLSAQRAVVMRNSLLVHAWFTSDASELTLWPSVTNEEVVWRSDRADSYIEIIQLLGGDLLLY